MNIYLEGLDFFQHFNLVEIWMHSSLFPLDIINTEICMLFIHLAVSHVHKNMNGNVINRPIHSKSSQFSGSWVHLARYTWHILTANDIMSNGTTMEVIAGQPKTSEHYHLVDIQYSATFFPQFTKCKVSEQTKNSSIESVPRILRVLLMWWCNPDPVSWSLAWFSLGLHDVFSNSSNLLHLHS